MNGGRNGIDLYNEPVLIHNDNDIIRKPWGKNKVTRESRIKKKVMTRVIEREGKRKTLETLAIDSRRLLSIGSHSRCLWCLGLVL